MKLTKVHRVLKFKQSDWLKKYIDFNADKRKHATKRFEKDFLSWWIIVFMESLRKWIKVRLVNNTKNYWKNVSRSSFISQKIFNKNLIAIHETKPVLTLDKPIYVRFSLLSLSNTLMYEFHYKCIKTKYSANLLFTDIESIWCLWRFFKNLYDFSDYPQDSKFFDLASKCFIGKMKDEFKGKIIS